MRLFEKEGATWVKITDDGIEVDRREYEAATRPGSQNVQVNVSASSVASISNSIRQIVCELDQLGIDSAKTPEAKEKLKTLEKELSRTSPRWNVVRQVLHWALDFSRELFLRLAVLVAQHFIASKL